MSDEALGRLIGRELEDIDALLDRSSLLLETPVDSEPSFERLAALTTVLDSFYTSLERVFEGVVRRLDSTQPEGERWHTEFVCQLPRLGSDGRGGRRSAPNLEYGPSGDPEIPARSGVVGRSPVSSVLAGSPLRIAPL